MAHRNEELADKCSRLHGHAYRFVCHFKVIRQPGSAITTLFNDFDSKVEVMFKNEFDHRMLLNKNDPLFDVLDDHDLLGELDPRVLPFPSSVENLAFYLFGKILFFGFNLQTLEIKETDTSTVIYSLEDYNKDYTFLGHFVKNEFGFGSEGRPLRPEVKNEVVDNVGLNFRPE